MHCMLLYRSLDSNGFDWCDPKPPKNNAPWHCSPDGSFGSPTHQRDVEMRRSVVVASITLSFLRFQVFHNWRENMEKRWKTIVSAQLSVEVHWSLQLGDVYDTSELQCPAPAPSRQRPCLVCTRRHESLLPKWTVSLLMFIEDLPLYKLGLVVDQFFLGPLKGAFSMIRGWDGLLWK